MDYTYAKKHLYDEINNLQEFKKMFKLICESLDIGLYENNKLKDMDTFLGDITIAYLKYQHDVNKQRFSGLW